MELRPLGFGEIFDRAITLYVRNCVPFAGIVVVMIVPLAVLEYVFDVLQQPQLDALLRILRHPGTARTEHVSTIFDSTSSIGMWVILLLCVWLVWPFALNAVAVGVARLYAGKPVAFRACYDVVLRRWAPILGLLGMELVIVIGWYVTTLVVVILAVLFGAMATAASASLTLLTPLAVIVVVLGMLVLLAPVALALTFAMYAAVIEEAGVSAALASGFERIFSRAEFWRSVLFAIAAMAVMFVASLLVGILSLVAGFMHVVAVEVILDALSRAAISPFAVVLLAVYYFDVRIRREGFDLQAGIERLSAGAQVA